MAKRKRSKSSGRDLISQLPADIKHMILERLPTTDAAKAALLSTHWKDVWLRHGRLAFESDFYRCHQKHEYYGNSLDVVNTITNILFRRFGPVKKFALQIQYEVIQTDLDWWCLFLSRSGVEQLKIDDSSVPLSPTFKLPVCVFSCPTIKQLKLKSFLFCCPVNAPCVFPGLTSLTLKDVVIEGRFISSFPVLEELALLECSGIIDFDISAPKLVSLLFSAEELDEAEWRWLVLRWETIHTLLLCVDFLSRIPRTVDQQSSMFHTARNLQALRLFQLDFSNADHIAMVIQWLLCSPKLCELQIKAVHDIREYDTDYDEERNKEEGASKVLEDPKGHEDLKMLNTLRIDSFMGTRPQMLFVKTLLSMSVALDKVIVHIHPDVELPDAYRITKELLSLPRASQKAKLVFGEEMFWNNKVWVPELFA